MASRYLQKLPVPEGFQEILHDFTREILRYQPEDILEFGANYFEHKAQGKEYIMDSTLLKNQSQHKQYFATPHEQYGAQAQEIVQDYNRNNPEEEEEGQVVAEECQKQENIKLDKTMSQQSHVEEKQMAKEYVGSLSMKVLEQINDN